MTSKSLKRAQKDPLNIPLIVGLGVVLFIWIVIAVAGKTQKPDPTLTAAPPTKSAPGHPILLIKAPPENLNAVDAEQWQVNTPRPLTKLSQR